MSDQTPTQQPADPKVANPPEVRISGKSMWQAVGVVLTTIVGIWALFEASGLVSMLVISFFFGLALQPAVNRLHTNRGMRRGAAVGVVYLAGGVFVIFMIAILIPALVTIANVIGENASAWIANFNEFISSNLGLSELSPSETEEIADQLQTELRDWAASAFGTVLGIATTGIGLIFNMATIAMFTFYFAADAPRIQRAVLSLFDESVQERIGWTWDEAVRQTGGYFYSRSILMVINGLGFFFTMVLVGVPTALAAGLALFGAFVSVFIPAIGTYIGGAVPVLVTLGIQGWTAGLIVLGYVLAYQQIENYYLSPKISANTMSLNGGVAFGAALAGGALAGPMGAFMALPIAALITAVLSTYFANNRVVYQSPYADAEEEVEPSAETIDGE